MKRSLTILCLLTGLTLWGQTGRIASLQKAVQAETDPAKRLKQMFLLADEHESMNLDSLQQLVLQLEKMVSSTGTANDKLKLGSERIILLNRQGNPKEGVRIADSLLSLIDTNNKSQQEVYYRISSQRLNGDIAEGSYETAIAQSYRLMAFAERRHDNAALADYINNLGIIAYNTDHIPESKEWFRKSLDITAKNNVNAKARAYAYIGLAENYAWKEVYDTALYYLDMAMPICEGIENIYYMANVHLVRSTIYKWSHDYPKSKAAMGEAMVLLKQIKGDLRFSNEQLAEAQLYADIKEYDKAIELFKEGIAFIQDEHANGRQDMNFDILYWYYFGLAKCYKFTGKHELHEAVLEKMIEVKDSLNKVNSAQAIAEMRTQYEVKEKDNIIATQQLDIERKNVLFYTMLVILVLSGIIVWLLYSNYRRRQQLKLQLMQEEEKTQALKAVYDAEEKERRRIAADLHDNLGSYAASIKANVEALAAQSEDPQVMMSRLRSNSEEMVALLNDTIWTLKKDGLYLSDISNRIKVFLQRMRNNYPQINFDVEERLEKDRVLHPAQAYHLFMIIQEAVNNAIRHSGGNEVKIIFEAGEKLRIQITDNGTGIKEQSASYGSGNGCVNIRDRARAAGWVATWQPNEPQGTRVVIEDN